MRKMFEKPRDIMLYKEKNDEQEYGLAKKDFRICKKCLAVYSKKSWWHPRSHVAKRMYKGQGSKEVCVIICPACKMIEKKSYEGYLRIESVPRKYKEELDNLIHSLAVRIYKKDCQHRLIALRKYKGVWILTTTENQMAHKIAKKIKDAFNKVKINISHSKAPYDVERVILKFNPA